MKILRPLQIVRRARSGLAVIAAALSVSVLAGCGSSQSTVSTHSRPAHQIAVLWWWMLGVAGIVFLGAVAMLVIGWFRRSKPGLPLLGENERAAGGLVVLFGMAVPIVVLVALFVIGNVYVARSTEAPRVSSTAMTIEVVGRRWFWEVRYPGTAAVTANEIHIPVATRVNLVARTADVIHSFWVPALNRKIDMIPGQSNRILLEADRAGRYRGQCAEFCGPQHANMSMYVIAEPAAAFRAWLAAQARPAAAPAGTQAQRGAQVFANDQCASCHAIRGTSAAGTIGPDLTHVASRETLAALTIPNTPAELRAWIRDPQHIKPGNLMPALGLGDADLAAVVAYLQGLR